MVGTLAHSISDCSSSASRLKEHMLNRSPCEINGLVSCNSGIHYNGLICEQLPEWNHHSKMFWSPWGIKNKYVCQILDKRRVRNMQQVRRQYHTQSKDWLETNGWPSAGPILCLNWSSVHEDRLWPVSSWRGPWSARCNFLASEPAIKAVIDLFQGQEEWWLEHKGTSKSSSLKTAIAKLWRKKKTVSENETHLPEMHLRLRAVIRVWKNTICLSGCLTGKDYRLNLVLWTEHLYKKSTVSSFGSYKRSQKTVSDQYNEGEAADCCLI